MVEDPRKQTQAYLEKHKLPQLLEALTAQLMFSKPDNPRDFIVKALEMAKLEGTQPLYTVEDLHTMFAMFDITGQGKITMAQANAALRSALGADAGLRLDEEGAYLTRDQFTEAMQSALQGTMSHKGL